MHQTKGKLQRVPNCTHLREIGFCWSGIEGQFHMPDLVMEIYELSVAKCEHSHWSAGHCTHLLLADKSQTNFYAFRGSISDSIFVPVLVCMLAECNWSVCVCDINKLLPVEFLLLEVGGKVVEARPRVDPRKFASSLVWFG